MSSSTDLALNILLNAQDVSASSTMNAVGSVIKNLTSGNVMGAVGIAAAAAGAAIVGIGVQATQMAAQYQQSMNMVQALTGSNTQQMAQYDSGLKALAVDAGVAPNALAQGLYNVLSAGHAGADAMNILKLATEDAKIGMTDAATTTNALTNILNSFSVKSGDVVRVNGEMLQTVTLGKATFGQYASTITNAASTSVQYGVSMETMNAAWATLTSSGISAAHATTDYDQSLKVMYGNIGTVTTSLHKNGIAFDEAKFNAMSYGDKVQYLNNALDQARAKHVSVTGATQQAQQAIQTISQHIGTYKDNLSALSDKQSMAQKTQQAWAITQQGFAQQVSRLKAAWDVLMINLGNKLLPILGQVVGWITPIVTAFSNWVAGSGKLGGSLAGLQPIIDGIGQFIQTIFLPAWQGLVQTVQTQLVPAWNNLMVTLKPLLPYFQQFAVFLAGTVGASILLVVALISGLIGALAGLMNGIAIIIKGIVIFVQGAIQFLSGIITFFADLFTGKWDKLGGDLANIWGGIVNMFRGSWIVIEGIFVGAINALIGLINGFVAGVMGPLNSILSASHQATISVGQIPMLTVNTSTGGLATMPVYKSSIGKTTSTSQVPTANLSTLSTIPTGTGGATNVNIPASSFTPVTGAIGNASSSSLKSQQAAQVAAMKLSDTQNKAIATSGSSQVQALVDASKQAAAQGNMSLAKYDAAKAATLANQQKAAATKAASAAAKAARAAKAASDRAAKASASQKKHLQALAAAAQRHAATLAAHAAKLAQSANNHSALISAIAASTNQITTNQCAAAGVSSTPTALGVALPDYVNQTGYTQSAPIIQQAPAPASSGQTNVTVHVHTDSKDPKDHGQKVAEEVKKHMAKMLRGQSVAPRFTSGGIR